MNCKKIMILALAGILGAGSLVACSKSGDGTESGTAAGTTAVTEAATAIPRYDYLEADVSKNVTISKSAYTDVTLTISNNYKVEDEDVTAYIDKLCFQKREAINGSTQVKDKPLAIGDDAFIYYKGFIDGKEFDGGSNWDDESPHQLGLGSDSFIEGFEDALVGVVPNTTSKDAPFELKVTFPEDYGKDELNGKEATFRVVVMYSVQYKVPEYNWEFVEKTLKYELKEEFYASDRARLDEFEAYVRETLEESAAADIENAKIDALWNYLLEQATCKNLQKQEIDFYYNSYVSEIEYYHGYYGSYMGEEFSKLYPTVDEFAPIYMGLGEGGDWKAELTVTAEKMVKKDMIGHAIGEMEGIESITEEEYKAQIQYWVTSYSGYMTEADVVQSMGETFLRESAYSDKIRDWLLDRITFTFADGTPIDGTADTETETESESESETAEDTTDTTGDTVTDTGTDTSVDTAAGTAADTAEGTASDASAA